VAYSAASYYRPIRYVVFRLPGAVNYRLFAYGMRLIVRQDTNAEAVVSVSSSQRAITLRLLSLNLRNSHYN